VGGKEEAREAAAAAPITMLVPVPPPRSDNDEGPRSVQKSYTITKSRESWTDTEHDKFLKVLQL
jgi:hypothetical protein